MAGGGAGFGGWEYEAATKRFKWTDEVTGSTALTTTRATLMVPPSITPRGTLAHLAPVRGTKIANSRRSVEISELTVDLLKSHKRNQTELRLKLGPAWPDTDPAFPSTIGTPWLKRVFYRDYRHVVAAASEIADPRPSSGTPYATRQPASG